MLEFAKNISFRPSYFQFYEDCKSESNDWLEQHMGEFNASKLADFGAALTTADEPVLQEVLEELDVSILFFISFLRITDNVILLQSGKRNVHFKYLVFLLELSSV